MISRSLSLANFNKVDQKCIFCAILDEKSMNFVKNLSQKRNSIKQFSNAFLSLMVTTALCR